MRLKNTIHRSAALVAAATIGSLATAAADDESRFTYTLEAPEEAEAAALKVELESSADADDVEAQLRDLIERLELSADGTKVFRRRVIEKKKDVEVPNGTIVSPNHKLLHWPLGHEPRLDTEWSSHMFMIGPDGKQLKIGPDGVMQEIDVDAIKAFQGGLFNEMGYVQGTFTGGTDESPYYIGAVVTDAPEEVKRHLGLNENVGVTVDEVIEGTPAQKAGIKENDIIVKANGDFIGNREGLVMAIQEAGDNKIELEIVSRGTTKTITLKAAKREKPKILSTPFVPGAGTGMEHLVYPGWNPGIDPGTGWGTDWGSGIQIVPNHVEIQALRKEVQENRALLQKILERLDGIESDK